MGRCSWATRNVGCESCHGPASGYVKSHQTKGAYTASLSVGMIDLVGKVPAWVQQCTSCHVVDDQKLIAAGHPSGDDFDLGMKYSPVALHFKKKYSAADVSGIGRQMVAAVVAKRRGGAAAPASAAAAPPPGRCAGSGSDARSRPIGRLQRSGAGVRAGDSRAGGARVCCRSSRANTACACPCSRAHAARACTRAGGQRRATCASRARTARAIGHASRGTADIITVRSVGARSGPPDSRVNRRTPGWRNGTDSEQYAVARADTVSGAGRRVAAAAARGHRAGARGPPDRAACICAAANSQPR